MTKTILFYGPFNSRSRDTETVMLAMKNDGFRVLFLTQYEGKEINQFLRENNIESYSDEITAGHGWQRIIRKVIFLVKFCSRHQVDAIFSHLEPGNFVAVLASFFTKARLFVCRHHSDLYTLMGRDHDLSYRFTYRNAKTIVVVSQYSRKHMIEVEKINESTIRVIPLAYDFSLYKKPDENAVISIREKYSAELLLITVGRLDEFKRTELSIEVLKKLVDQGVDAKLIIAGIGDLLPALKQQAINGRVSDRVFFTGFVTNILDYLKAADFVLHPSISEASCVVIKEAGLVRKPVIVCSGVGDFDDYIVTGENGFLVSKQGFVEEAMSVLVEYHRENERIREIGIALESAVLERFAIENVYPIYKELLS